jgi:GT2 family glycosyltransferase
VTANAAFPMELVRRLGGLDESLRSGSDVDLCWRMARAGFEITTAPGAVIRHESRATVRSYFRQFYHYALGHAALASKYRSVTGRRRIGDWYPLRGLARVAMREAPSTLPRFSREQYMRLWLQVVEHLALLAGDMTGFLRYGVLYV